MIFRSKLIQQLIETFPGQGQVWTATASTQTTLNSTASPKMRTTALARSGKQFNRIMKSKFMGQNSGKPWGDVCLEMPVQYKSLSTLSDKARNRLKGGF